MSFINVGRSSRCGGTTYCFGAGLEEEEGLLEVGVGGGEVGHFLGGGGLWIE